MLSIRESLRLTIDRSMEVYTMSACVTFDVCCFHSFLCGFWMLDLCHCCILPRVLTTVQEENVVTCDIEASVMFIDFVNDWLSNVITEYSFAIV